MKKIFATLTEVQRGTIFAGGEAIASSIPSDDVYSWKRTYPDAPMWAPVTGYINPVLRSSTGLEQAMTAALSGSGSQQFPARLEQIVSGTNARNVDRNDLSLPYVPPVILVK